jgi:NCS1 family nucleobase:cation symporter-1
MLLIPPERLQLPFKIAFVMIITTMFGMLGWSINTAGGAGPLLSAPPTKTGSTLSWNIVYGLQTLIGTYGTGILGQSDWTRYSKNPRAALFGQAVTCPLAITLTACCGILITSASVEIFDGEYLWNPFELLITAQTKFGFSPRARAGTFFAALGLSASQLLVCIALNGMSSGMDMAALAPRWINIRRGQYITTVIAIAICPWNYVTQATVFITVLSGWSVFLVSPLGFLREWQLFLPKKVLMRRKIVPNDRHNSLRLLRGP